MHAIDSSSLSLTEEDKLLCPVRTLSFYLDRVKEFRSPAQKRLIISYQRGLEEDLSSQTISRYIKEAIILAHKESNPSSLNYMTVRPHSARHIATSLSAVSECIFVSLCSIILSESSLSKFADLGGFVAASTLY